MEVSELFLERGLPWDRHPSIADNIDAADCWAWNGSRSTEGYGVTTYQGRQVKVHRLIWETLVGPLGNLTIDHLCRNRACVNPDHLEPVSSAANVMRGYSPHAKHARQTKCIYGHVFTDENTVRFGDGYRHCRTCLNDRSKEN